MKFLLTVILFIFQCAIYAQLSFAPLPLVKTEDGSLVNIETVLQQYIRVPSVSGNEKKAGEFLKSVCRNNGLHITDFGSENGQYNFAASIFPLSSGKPNIIFLNHLDVVPESKSETRDPYCGTIENGMIYGRGAIDNKGAAMIQLYGILSLLSENDLTDSPYNITLLAVSCEEIQCDGGVQYVIDHYFDTLNPAVVFGEGPSELTTLMEGEFDHPVFGISTIHKKPLWLELKLESTTVGHGSITPLTYANKEMVDALDRLTRKKPQVVYNDVNTKFLKDMAPYYSAGKKMALRHPKLFSPILTGQLRKFPELFSLFTNTITLTNFYSDSKAVNKLASKAYAHLDCRLLPETDEMEFLSRIKKHLGNDNIEITVLNTLPPFEASSPETVFFKNLSLAIKDKYPNAKTIDMMMPNINDLWAFRTKNVPAYGTLPIFCETEEVRSVHGSDEHLKISSLYDGAEVYYYFLKRMIRIENPLVKN
jgi:carboxypeptidase PM20D1